jgi:retron-type reverse transcriptase
MSRGRAESIPHHDLMQAVEERVCDQAVLTLIRALLRAGAMEGGSLRRRAAGTPQGGVISPLLCNAYLHRLDRAGRAGEHGVLVRYADLCRVRHKSAYAEGRIMPTMMSDALVRAVGGVLMSA